MLAELSKEEIREQINQLPRGGIYTKRIRGKDYEYWQFRQDGKTVSRRVKGAELSLLRAQIEERKRLQTLLQKDVSSTDPTASPEPPEKPVFMDGIRTGDALLQYAEGVQRFRKRECYQELHDYIFGPRTDMVFILYGLRRTGKTTLIRQILLDMTAEMRSRSAFLQITTEDTLSGVNRKIQELENYGYRYLFLDEVTLMDDFIQGAALFSDIYAASGIKIVLSGTDSLGFLFSEDEQLYDRCRMLHTTFIPYREFDQVLGIKGIDEYIRFGGTMSLGGTDYNRFSFPFETLESTNEYIDSAIARNIQHSLKNYQYEGHFRSLYELYEKNELTSAINRVVEDMNHRFTLDVLTHTFRSHDLGVSRNNLQRDRTNPSMALSEIDEKAVTERLRHLLEIREREEMQVQLRPYHVQEIKEYLALLDLIVVIDDVSMNKAGTETDRIIFSQPGLRYSQAEALITSLLQDPAYFQLGIRERMRITERILNEIRGRMMEDIVLLETKKAYPECKVFPLRFPIGEFDMVVFDPKRIQCRLYEIKHSTERNPAQSRHLRDADKCAQAEMQFGTIIEKSIIYRGKTIHEGEIKYRNVEEYLLNLPMSVPQ